MSVRSITGLVVVAFGIISSAVPFDTPHPVISPGYLEKLRAHTLTKRQSIGDGTFGDEFSSIPSSPNLVWHSCYGANNYQCARFVR
jgi:hypothetical protein